MGLAVASLFCLSTAVLLALFLKEKGYGFIVGGIGFLPCCFPYMDLMGLSSFSEENRKHRTSMIGSILNRCDSGNLAGTFFIRSIRMEEKERLKNSWILFWKWIKSRIFSVRHIWQTETRKENDAEHSWHLALMAVLLKEYSNEEVDLSKVIPMVLSMILWRSMLEIPMHMMRKERSYQGRQRAKSSGPDLRTAAEKIRDMAESTLGRI